MKNKELLNICYKFFNRYITVNELIERLKGIDLKEYTDEDKKEIKKLIREVEKIEKEHPNKEDEFVKSKRKALESLIKKLDQLPEEDNILTKQIDSLKKELDKETDSHERWFEVTKYINDNKYFNDSFESLSQYELLEFIAQYIRAPFPPQLKQEEFDELVKAGKEKDEREWLWRLAFNYESSDLDINEIANYFIEIKDGYYLAELISAVGEKLNIDAMIEKISDKALIKDLEERKDVIKHYVNEEQLNKLLSKVKD